MIPSSKKKCEHFTHVGVSKNSGTPQIMYFNVVFHYKPSILGVLPPIFETPMYTGCLIGILTISYNGLVYKIITT